MKIPVKMIGLPILSLSLLSSGCGEAKETDERLEGGAEVSFMPLATKDAKLALALNLV